MSFSTPFRAHFWVRDPRNPILPPGTNAFDATRCMNPYALRVGGEYYLFYSGGDTTGHQRICLATAPVDDLSQWTRHGVVLDVGAAGTFDERWCVLPAVHKIGGRWHLYYTGRNASATGGLQTFTGIGLAVSDDLHHWDRLGPEPVLRGDTFPQFPGNLGIAGGARLLEMTNTKGELFYRMHYTLATGTPSSDLLIDQQKYAVSADSSDGVTWGNYHICLGPRQEADYENAAIIALNVWPVRNGWRAIYAGIGTRYGAYSICEARSLDGLTWDRGLPDENLAIAPEGEGWESKMVEYPNVIEENGRLRLFYCGNQYGGTGIGTALAEPIDPLTESPTYD